MSVILFIICLIVIFALAMLALFAVGKRADADNEEIIKEPNPAKTKLIKLDEFEECFFHDFHVGNNN
jgi:flagellar basal body-associated protein FliL